jgi:predicted dehydrogenase
LTLQTFRTTHARGVDAWRPDWRRSLAIAGGGIAMDHGSHTFYLAFDWLGSYPTAVTAKMARSAGYDTEDEAACVLTFPTGLAVAHMSWNAGVRKVIYTLHGERGAIRVEDDEIELSVRGPGRPLVERSTASSDWGDASHVTWYGRLLDHLAAAISGGEHVGDDAREALLCVRLIETAYASDARGCRELSLRPSGPELEQTA